MGEAVCDVCCFCTKIFTNPVNQSVERRERDKRLWCQTLRGNSKYEGKNRKKRRTSKRDSDSEW